MTVTANIWRELGSFSSFLGYIPYNILLASENVKNEVEVISHGRKEKFGLKNMLPTFGYVRDFFNVNRSGAANLPSGSVGAKENSKMSGLKLTRNDLEQRLANKIQELKKSNVNKRNKQSSKKIAKTSHKGAESKAKEDELPEPSLEFGRIVDGSLSAPNSATYMQKKEPKMKKINDALKTLKKQQELISSLPKEEREAKIKEIAMEKAMKKAQGIKVKDNKSKLIKTKKTILAKKKKSKQKWAEISKKNNIKK